MKSLTVGRLLSQLPWLPRGLLASVLAMAMTAATFATPASVFAQSEDAIGKVKDLNQKALAAYENLELEEARKALLEALQICAQEGMNDHPWKARTHIHLGAILAGGFQQKELALKQFQRALEIQPEIQLTPSLRNPETSAAFEEAKKGGRAKTAPDVKPAEPPTSDKPVAEPAKVVESSINEPAGIFHQPVANAPVGSKVDVKAKATKIKFSRMVLAYRPEGATGFLARDMDAGSDGWYSARIPEAATQGGLVQYYVEARDDTGRAVANNGSETEPHVVALGNAAAAVDDASLVEADPETPLDKAAPPSGDAIGFVFGVSLGSGLGYVSGTPEVNRSEADDGDDTTAAAGIKYSGMAPAKLGHLNIEGGYAVRPGFIVSLTLRFQKVSGATDAYSLKNEGGVLVAKKFAPAAGAIAALAKATWLLGAPGSLRPYVSVLGGAGELRHVVDIGDKRADCGPLPNPDKGIDPSDPATIPKDRCIDTVNSGPMFAGGAAGVMLKLGDSLGLTAGINVLLGIPRVTVHADLNVGMLLLL